VSNRKPRGTDWGTWIDTVIQEGRDRGEFDNLPGAGKPIEGLDKPHDELWWVRKKLKDEGISYLPPTLALRKEREDALAAVESLTSEARVRELLERLNQKIRAANRRPSQGPPSTVVPVDVDQAVARWKQRRATGGAPTAAAEPEERATDPLAGAPAPGREPAAGERPRRFGRRRRR
jgi:hypothetical protein